MNYYQRRKNMTRNEAIMFQETFDQTPMSYAQLIDWENYFYIRAKRYGLLKEFKENGII